MSNLTKIDDDGRISCNVIYCPRDCDTCGHLREIRNKLFQYENLGCINMSKNDELREVARPLVEYIRKNYHPHTTVIVDCNHAEVLEGVAVAKFGSYDEEDKNE